MIYIVALKIQIKMVFLKKIIIIKKYLDYINIFLPKFIVKFLKYNNNNYVIKLKKSKQLYYNSIYNLIIIKLKILIIYIKINLVNNFIWFLKFFANALILFDKKKNS